MLRRCPKTSEKNQKRRFFAYLVLDRKLGSFTGAPKNQNSKVGPKNGLGSKGLPFFFSFFFVLVQFVSRKKNLSKKKKKNSETALRELLLWEKKKHQRQARVVQSSSVHVC